MVFIKKRWDGQVGCCSAVFGLFTPHPSCQHIDQLLLSLIVIQEFYTIAIIIRFELTERKYKWWFAVSFFYFFSLMNCTENEAHISTLLQPCAGYSPKCCFCAPVILIRTISHPYFFFISVIIFQNKEIHIKVHVVLFPFLPVNLQSKGAWK